MKSVKPFRTYCNIQNLALSFDPDFWGQGHQVLFFYSLICSKYTVKILTKPVKPFRTYCNIQNLTLRFDLDLLGQGQQVIFF